MSPAAPRRVLLLHSSAGRYGADRQLLALAAGLDPARYVPQVVLAEDGELAEDLRAAQVEVTVRGLAVVRRELLSPTGLVRLSAGWAADAGWLGRLARERGIALVHTNTSVTLGGAAAARAAGVPHVWHVREIYAGWARAWPAYRRLLLTADALPCVSRATAEQFDAAPQVEVLPDGLAVDATRAPREEARRALGLPPAATVVAVLGRISAWKGQDVLVEALGRQELRDRAGVHLAIAGEAWRGDPAPVRALRDRAAQLGVADRVHLPGFVADPGLVYGAADVVVVPSTQPDPFPNAALEAAAAGCCVVASAHGGLPEMLIDGVTAVLVAPGDAGALARALGALADDPERRLRLGAAAAADVAARFGRARMLEAVQARYDALLSVA